MNSKHDLLWLKLSNYATYKDGEIKLNYLKRSLGYRYEMNNCLIDEGIRDIIWRCRCIPNFVLIQEATEYFEFLSFCTGNKLKCANTRLKSLGIIRFLIFLDFFGLLRLKITKFWRLWGKVKSCHFKDTEDTETKFKWEALDKKYN